MPVFKLARNGKMLLGKRTTNTEGNSRTSQIALNKFNDSR